VADGREVTHVAIKVRTPTFFTRTKISKLDDATTDAAVVADKAIVVWRRFELTRPVRLLGVRVQLRDEEHTVVDGVDGVDGVTGSIELR
jgi:DNA polymerase-4